MKWVLVAIVAFSALWTLSECSVIYRKYTRTIPPRTKNQKKITEIVEIFSTYRRPPFFGSSEQQINEFLRDDGPPPSRYPNPPTATTPTPRPIERVTYPYQRPSPPPSIFESRRSTTIPPNPYENDNGFMNRIPGNSVTTTKFVTVPNFTIREEEPRGAAPEEEPTEEPETTTEEEVTEQSYNEEREEVTEQDDHEAEEEVTTEAVLEEEVPQAEREVPEPEEEVTEAEQEEVTEPEPVEEEVTEEPTTITPEEEFYDDDEKYEDEDKYDDNYGGNTKEEIQEATTEVEEEVTEPVPERTTRNHFSWW